MTTIILRFQEALLPGWIKQQLGHVEEAPASGDPRFLLNFSSLILLETIITLEAVSNHWASLNQEKF